MESANGALVPLALTALGGRLPLQNRRRNGLAEVAVQAVGKAEGSVTSMIRPSTYRCLTQTTTRPSVPSCHSIRPPVESPMASRIRFGSVVVPVVETVDASRCMATIF